MMQLRRPAAQPRPAASPCQWAARGAARGVHNRCCALSKPSNPKEVVSFAQQQFLQEISKPDSSINLAKACLVLALEEEARLQCETMVPSNRTGATASTWSLSRLEGLAAEVLNSLAAQHGSSDADSSGGSEAAGQAAKARLLAFPGQALTAVNTVLFDRHGYSACNRFGRASDSQLAAVLESGPGSCAALTVLYLEVCSRLGLVLQFKVLEEGRYCLAWPRELLLVAGQPLVVDVYGKGALLTVKEVTELFGLSSEELFAGSSRRELLAALLAEQQHTHWCSAIGCSAQPAFMTPLTASTAVKQQVKRLEGLSIERATAAAEKRVALLPGDPAAQLQLALLCYFAGRYEDAWLELGAYIEAVRSQRQQQPADPIANADAAARPSGLAASGVREVSTAMQLSASATATTSTCEHEDDAGFQDVLLLFEKLQLELLLASSPPPSATA